MYRDVRRYDGQRGWFLPDDHLPGNKRDSMSPASDSPTSSRSGTAWSI